MGDLHGFLKFLSDTEKTLTSAIGKLETIQKTYNVNFNSIVAARTAEIEFLRDEFFKNEESFQPAVRKKYLAGLSLQTKIFDDKMSELKGKKIELMTAMARLEDERINLLKRIKGDNQKLDGVEERLKKDVADLEERIDEYNEKISELTGGFGFITNFFGMRKIRDKKEALLSERDTLVVRIEEVRGQWGKKEQSYAEKTDDIQERWNNKKLELALVTEKIGHIGNNRDDIIRNAALMAVLDGLGGSGEFIPEVAGEKPPEYCPSCKNAVGSSRFFCSICGFRFVPNRTDISGSLVETGELNMAFNHYITGITGSVSTLALMKGILQGVEKFSKSMISVKASQDRYSALAKLIIDVPGKSAAFAKKIEEFNGKIDAHLKTAHPLAFAEAMKTITEKDFAEKNIASFFNQMGEELNRATGEQW